ncbi:MAG: Hpt domain-containing protein [Candidatus Azotimanducaceae bacterium]
MTDPAGLLPSSFARIRFDVLPGSRCSATSGVDPTQSSMVGYLMLTLPESTHRMIVQSLLPENNEPNLSSERLNLTPVIRKEESVKHQGTQDLDRQALGSGERFPKSEGLDHGKPLAPPLARDDPATDSHIQTVDLAQLFARSFHPQSTQRGNINIDLIGRQIALHLSRWLNSPVYFSASHTMPRHFSANLLEFKTMVSHLIRRLEGANLKGKAFALTCQWSASDHRINMFAARTLSDPVLARASCPDCTPLDNRFPQQNLRARVTLKDPFEAKIVQRWLLRQGIGPANNAEPGSILHISEKVVAQLASNTKGRRPEQQIIAQVDQPNHWLSDIEQTILTHFQGGSWNRLRNGVTVIHSFDIDPNQSPLIRLLIQSKIKFRIATEHGTLGRQQHSIRDTLLIDFTLNGANRDPLETSRSLSAWPDAIIITQPPLTPSSSTQSSSTQSPSTQSSSTQSTLTEGHFSKAVAQKSLSLNQLANVLAELGPRNDLTEALSKLLRTERSGLDPKLPPLAAKAPSRTARSPSRDPATAAPLIFDEQLALLRAGGNQALALELKALLRSTLEDDLLDLITAARAQDLERTREVLHKMTGGLAMTGASRLEKQVRTSYLGLSDATSPSRVKAVIIQAEQLLTILGQSKTP